MKLKLLLTAAMVFLVIVTGCARTADWSPQTCSQDGDCLPDSCCHARDTVNKESAPDCTGVICTAVCEPGTLDCGQGEIKCIESHCTAIMKS